LWSAWPLEWWVACTSRRTTTFRRSLCLRRSSRRTSRLQLTCCTSNLMNMLMCHMPRSPKLHASTHLSRAHAFSLATLSLSTLNQKQTTLDLDVVHVTAASTCSDRWRATDCCKRACCIAFRVADQSSGFSFITGTSIVVTLVCSIDPSCRSNLVDHPCSPRLVSPRPCRARAPWCAL
jgi:hypothetical protein